MSVIKAACVQMNAKADIQTNLQDATFLIRKAVSQGANFIVTPENTDRILMDVKEKLATAPTAEEHPGIPHFAALAKELKIWLLIGSMGIKVSDTKVANRSHFFSPEGKLVTTYDKIHMFDVVLSDTEAYKESESNEAGARSVLIETDFANIGLSICYDLRFPHLYRNLAKNGAQILCVPAAFTVPTGKAHWHTLLRSRAIETGCFVLAPAQTGEHHSGRLTYGHSLIIAPWGEIIAELESGEGVITADLDLRLVEQARKSVPSLHNDREFNFDKIKA